MQFVQYVMNLGKVGYVVNSDLLWLTLARLGVNVRVKSKVKGL
jgi:hypothetical protein